jgi:hypothetical protein
MNTNFELDAVEKKLTGYDYKALHSATEAAIANIKTAKTPADIKTEICKIWSMIKPFAPIIEKIPFVGKIFKALEILLDAICANAGE